ncbi:hypothetical protein [Pseudoduganella umbonata]|uniref:DUF2116 family Zn-ribbon domain-containing protein n=1 Tax=Pseudoduganella umbonata TaxID=864828 RepID=A0A4P8HU07_9BURK|nr:hypothetical protein [Pseudoduganella umbonata]MBB3225226.1 hypothetical protein [Pseudoduganella umbonata]QCP12242.1 hypothetical protein FCL38_18830 [Pseudoduganella umbonata]
METTEQAVPDSAVSMMPSMMPAMAATPRQKLPPKGSCWYCEKPLDSVKRFCGRDCASSFDEEALYTG